jgi:putative transcription factor
MCGKEYKGCRPAVIDGVKMMLCQECIKYAEAVQSTEPPRRVSGPSTFGKPRASAPSKDVFTKMEKELVNDWSKKIQQAREKKGLTREELGFRIGERTVTISKLENGDLRPSDKMVQKLEKELEITLYEEVMKPVTPIGGRPRGEGFTLGDFIKDETK